VWAAAAAVIAAIAFGTLGRAAARMRRTSFPLELDLHLGKGTARMLASDLSPAYVRFNAAYTT